MQASLTRRFELVCHPASPRPAVSHLQVQLGSGTEGSLRLSYGLEGDIASLRIPSPAAAERADELWRHTCFEAFVSLAGSSSYLEINFSPSSRWALYRFDGYRRGMAPVMVRRAPEIAVRSSAGRLELDATVQLDEITELRDPGKWRVGLAAVVEADDGNVSYWALRHTCDKPDFHAAETFVARLEAR